MERHHGFWDNLSQKHLNVRLMSNNLACSEITWACGSQALCYYIKKNLKDYFCMTQVNINGAGNKIIQSAV